MPSVIVLAEERPTRLTFADLVTSNKVTNAA